MTATDPKRGWFHLSPDRLIVGLLAVEGVLFLSERFQWFAFNERKGWTVLIAVAAVCLAVIVMLLWLIASLLFRWRFQFSLRSLVALVVAVAVSCCWFAAKMRQAERQRRTVEAIRKAGLWVQRDYEWEALVAFDETGYCPNSEPPAPEWIMELIGEDLFTDIVGVLSDSEDRPEAVMEHLGGLTTLKRLELGGTQVTDAGLEHLNGLTNLLFLQLWDTKVSDGGLEHLTRLTNLRRLELSGTQVTDAGLEHLKGLTNLKRLSLSRTQVTDAGLEDLKGLTNVEELRLDHTQVTDAGLEHLKGLTQLESMFLSETQITGTGLVHLEGQRNLKVMYLAYTPVTDAELEHLRRLGNLEVLRLDATPVTADGIEGLRKALPNCKIRWFAPPATKSKNQP